MLNTIINLEEWECIEPVKRLASVRKIVDFPAQDDSVPTKRHLPERGDALFINPYNPKPNKWGLPDRGDFIYINPYKPYWTHKHSPKHLPVRGDLILPNPYKPILRKKRTSDR